MYNIVFTAEAARSLRKVPRNVVVLIRKKLEQIAKDPYAHHPNATKLQSRQGYRLRVGDWRVIYDINQDEVAIIVIKIAPRGEVYR